MPLQRTGAASGYTHEKLMFVSGRYAGSRDASFVWTGSHNWTDRSLHNDEVTLRVAGASARSRRTSRTSSGSGPSSAPRWPETG